MVQVPLKWRKFFVENTSFSAVYLQGLTIAPSILESIIDLKIPPIVEIQAWKSNDSLSYATDWVDGHYNVMIGYDNNTYYFMDPWLGKYVWISKLEFLSRWHDTDTGMNDMKSSTKCFACKE